MNTPLYDFLTRYAAQHPLRMHMPGHKGTSLVPELAAAYALDITEIDGADSLYEADGILRESERNAAALFGTVDTCFSAEGSSLCIRTMLALMKREGRTVIAARNVHHSFLSACVLLGLEVRWLYPDYTGGLLSGVISPAALETALAEVRKPACVFVTSPDYLGKCVDIAALASVCHAYDAPLLVDNAHGSHLAFLPQNHHPAVLGADLCCDSAHKTLPALTGAAYLHIMNPRYAAGAKSAMTLFGSTSPSYLILNSLDLCNRYLETEIRPALVRVTRRLALLKTALAGRAVFYDGEPLHLTLCASRTGLDGRTLAVRLREAGVACEYADRDFVVLLCSPMTTDAALDRLEDCLTALLPVTAERHAPQPFSLPRLSRVLPLREAALAAYETIPVEAAVGRICAGVRVPCPPAIPIAVSGEKIDADCVNIFKRYGILTVDVVK